MPVEESIEAKVSENIAVHQQKVIWKVRNQSEWRDGAERLQFPRIVDGDSPLRSIAKKCLNQVGLMIDGHGNARKALLGQLPDDHFEDWIIADGHQRLRQHNGVGAERVPRPPARITARRLPGSDIVDAGFVAGQVLGPAEPFDGAGQPFA